MLGLEKGIVRLFDYDVQWPLIFEKERRRIEQAIGDIILSLHHVGSTSVPGLCAKPIIDILIGLETFECGFQCVMPLEQLGYTFRGENGIPGRHYFRKGDPRTFHVHMFEKNSSQWHDHILFADYLRKNPERKQQYAELKRALAQAYPKNRVKYTNSKSEFIQETIRLASYTK
jgi:GrpB-like predicted nucleotidyltransferase (UPF0157 family)